MDLNFLSNENFVFKNKIIFLFLDLSKISKFNEYFLPNTLNELQILINSNIDTNITKLKIIKPLNELKKLTIKIRSCSINLNELKNFFILLYKNAINIETIKIQEIQQEKIHEKLIGLIFETLPLKNKNLKNIEIYSHFKYSKYSDEIQIIKIIKNILSKGNLKNFLFYYGGNRKNIMNNIIKICEEEKIKFPQNFLTNRSKTFTYEQELIMKEDYSKKTKDKIDKLTFFNDYGSYMNNEKEELYYEKGYKVACNIL